MVTTHVRSRVLWALATLVAMAALAGIVGLRSRGHPEPSTARPAALCADGLEPIAGGACFAAPAIVWGAPLVVYMHGNLGAGDVDDERARQSRVARMAAEQGFALLALRGAASECESPEQHACWPSNRGNIDAAPRVVASFRPALDEAGRRTGRDGHRFLLGFGSGGAFAAAIVNRSLMTFDAFAIANAGAPEPMRAQGSQPPILLLSASDDPSDERVQQLDQELTRAGWPHAMVQREGTRSLGEWDVDMALAFFSRSRAPLASEVATPPADVGTTQTTSAEIARTRAQPAPIVSSAPSASTAPADVDADVDASGEKCVVVLVLPGPTPELAPAQPSPEAPPPAPSAGPATEAPAPPAARGVPTSPPAGVPTSPPAGVPTSPPAGVPTDEVPSQPYYPYQYYQ